MLSSQPQDNNYLRLANATKQQIKYVNSPNRTYIHDNMETLYSTEQSIYL